MFNLTEQQDLKLKDWLETLTPKHGCYEGAIGGRLTYSFTPTSLGEVVKVKDCMSDAEIDLTDYDSW